MKLNRKNLSRVATTFVATAMIAALAAVPAYAEDPNTYAEENVTLFSTKLNMENADGAGVPNVTFEYEITSGPAKTTITTTDGTNKSIDILQGVANPTIETSVSFSSADPGTKYDSNDDTIADDGYEKNVSATFPAGTFTAPGIYRFNLTQKDVAYKGVTLDATKDYYLDVYVTYDNDTNPTKLTVSNVTLVDTGANPTFNGSGINYGTLGTAKYEDIENTFTTCSVIITKKVAGVMGDRSKEFDFDISVTDPNTEKVLSSLTSSQEGEITFADGAANVGAKMKHDGTVTISGIPAGTTLDIVENDVADYTVTYAANTGSTPGAVTITDNNNATCDVTVNSNGGDVLVTNTRQNVTPTGVIMNVAPYVLMVVIAAAGCFVFLRKRRDD